MRLRDWSVLPTVTLGTAGLQLSVDRAGQATFVALGGTPLVLDEEPVLTAAVDDGARLACVVTASGRLMIVGPDGVHATAALGIPASAVALDGTAFMATVGCDDGSVRILWFSDPKMSVETLRGPQGFIEDVAIAPSASHVAALTQNGRLHVWDTRDGGHRTERPLWRVASGGSARHGWCQLGEDGADAVLFGDQGAFRLPLSRDALVAHARQVQPRTLTDEDWLRYIGDALG